MGSCCLKEGNLTDRSKQTIKNTVIINAENARNFILKEGIQLNQNESLNSEKEEEIINSEYENIEPGNMEIIKETERNVSFENLIEANERKGSRLSLQRFSMVKIQSIIELCVPPNENRLSLADVQLKRKGSTKDLIKASKEEEAKMNIFEYSELNSTNNESKLNISINVEYKGNQNKQLLKKSLNSDQVTFILNVLTQVNYVNDEMDTDFLQPLIKLVKYFKVKKSVDFLNETDANFFYFLESGKVFLESEKEDIVAEEGICFSYADLGNKIVQAKCVTALETTFLFGIELEAYGNLITNYNIRVKNEKMQYISNISIFKYLDQSRLIALVDELQKKFYYEEDNTPILIDGEMPDRIFIITKGSVKCWKEDKLIKKLSDGDYFGDISLFCQMESYFSYEPEEESVLYELKYESILNIIGENYIKDLIFNIFVGSIKKSEQFSKHLNKNFTNNFFNLFHLKYYFKDTVCSLINKKVCVVISGRLMTKKTYKIVGVSGDLFGENIIDEVDGYDNIVSEDECVIFEAPWESLLKSLKCPSNLNMSIYERFAMLKNLVMFSHLSEWKLFQLAESLKYQQYKINEVIEKEDLVKDNLYIIKTGKIKVLISNIFIKELNAGECFGEINGLTSYSRPATFISKAKVECFVLEKENYDEVVGLRKNKTYENSFITKDITITLENLFFVKDLGHGSFGKVFKVHNEQNFYACKAAEIKTCKQKNIFKYFINEKNIMASLEHPFIVKLVNTFKTKEHLFFLMEYLDGVTLKTYLDSRKRGKTRDLYEVQFYGAILLTIANYLQRMRVIHRDIKPANCMIEKNGYLKLIDFGVSKDMTGSDFTTTMLGTSHYMAPEIIQGKGYSFSADYWSIGVLMFEIFYGCLPFGNNSMGLYEVYDEITEKKLSLPSDKKYEELNDFLKGILNKDPNRRIRSFSMVKNHAFFKNFKFDALLNFTLTSPANNKKLQTDRGHSDIKDSFLSSTFPFDNYIENEYYSRKENDGYSGDSENDINLLDEF